MPDQDPITDPAPDPEPDPEPEPAPVDDSDPVVVAPGGMLAEYVVVSPDIASVEDVDFSEPVVQEEVDGFGFLESTDPLWQDGPSDYFAARYTTEMTFDEASTYRFELWADDGAVLRIDGQTVLSNEGAGFDEHVTADVQLDAGSHVFEMLYLERDGEQSLDLKWAGLATDGQMQPFGPIADLVEPPTEPVPEPPAEEEKATLEDGRDETAEPGDVYSEMAASLMSLFGLDPDTDDDSDAAALAAEENEAELV